MLIEIIVAGAVAKMKMRWEADGRNFWRIKAKGFVG